ncbi:MAG TPA: hypothetical protein VM509_09510, partial [Planctomycetota bacterium]|nr:hypothetical protein [Planctomycetota bacterium]
MRSPSPAQCLTTVVLLVATALPVSAQRSEAQIRADIDFARGLAADWGFADMAKELLARLEKQTTNGRVLEEVRLLECEVEALSASRVTDRAERDRLLKAALAAYASYVDAHPTADNQLRAQSAYLRTALDYGRSHFEASEAAGGSEIDALQDTLVQAASRTAKLANDLRAKNPRNEADDRELVEVLL